MDKQYIIGCNLKQMKLIMEYVEAVSMYSMGSSVYIMDGMEIMAPLQERFEKMKEEDKDLSFM